MCREKENNMPSKAKVTKEMILDTVLKITKETGFETVNARSIANKLQCSTRPIFTCYENMEELKKEFLNYAFEYYNEYVKDYKKSIKPSPCLLLPLSYIEFAKSETYLFKLLFINDMDLDMTETNDFYKEIGNGEKAKEFSDEIGVKLELGKQIFLDFFLYSHGIAVLTATEKLSLDSNTTKKMLSNFLTAFTKQYKTSKAGE